MVAIEVSAHRSQRFKNSPFGVLISEDYRKIVEMQ